MKHPSEESPTLRAERHKQHTAMLAEHKERKAIARERHRNHWHQFKVIPILL